MVSVEDVLFRQCTDYNRMMCLQDNMSAMMSLKKCLNPDIGRIHFVAE